MKLSPLNINNNLKQGGNFKGKTPKVDDLIAIKRFANCCMGGLEKRLIDSIENKAPKLLQNVGGEKYIPDDAWFDKVKSVFKSFFEMPLDVINYIAKKFPKSKLNNAEFLQEYRAYLDLNSEVRALQGIYENTFNFMKKSIPEGGKYPTGRCDAYCKSVCGDIGEEFTKKLNTTVSDDVANYDTKKERFATRLVSGFTAALFLGNDFYNKSIQKGRTKKEAQKEQRKKRGQEIKENICEAITQFAVFACFSRTVNSNVWAPAIIGTVIGLVSRVISRKLSGMRITRIDVPEKNNHKKHFISMNEFIESAENGNIEKLSKEKNNNEIKNSNTKDKKPILNFKNILAMCALSIAGGYALRFGKNHTRIGQKIAGVIKQWSDKLNEGNVKEIIATPKELNELLGIMDREENNGIARKIHYVLNSNKKRNEIVIGTDFVTTKKLFGIEVKVKDLKAIITAPIRFVKELVSYPYKIVSKLEEAIKNSKIKDAEPNNKSTSIKDPYDIINIYKRFIEYKEKYGSDEKKLSSEFSKYIREMEIISNNEVTSSKGNNSKIAVIAQTLGTLTGMWFNMNDEFNASVRNGSTKKEAEKDARLRGINKFFRMTIQVIISGSLNSLFSKQYNSSIAKSAAVVAASTILTDMASRVLSGMPSKKMTKDELEKYQKNHKEGAMSWYYKLIDKLAS